MTKASGSLQDLRRGIYVKAKAEPSWRFWGPYVHVCKMETLQQAYSLAKKNNGAPGIDGVTFEAIEALGVADFLNGLQDELTTRTYKPLRARRTEIPKDGGKDGYRPKRTAHQAVDRVARAIVERKTCVIDLDLRAYFDTVRHDVLLGKVARRVNDDDVMRLLKR